MNWYKKANFNKRASVTFSPEGIHKMAQPMTVLDLCHELSSFGWYTAKIFRQGQGVNMESFQPDGDSWNKYEGIINLYVPTTHYHYDEITNKGERIEIPVKQQLSEGQVTALVKEFNDHMIGQVVLGEPKEELSNMTGGVVYRIPVIENHTKDIEQVPEMNLANGTAKVLLEILARHGLNVVPSEYAGEFDVDDYIGARQLMSDKILEQHTRPAVDDGKMFDFGIDMNRINAYLDGLDQIAVWIKKNNLPDQKIVFA